jgi:hypothetical protein
MFRAKHPEAGGIFAPTAANAFQNAVYQALGP